MPRRTCRGTNAEGDPCESPVVDENGWCPAHGPDGSEKMSEIGRKGAESTAKKLKADGLEASDLPDLDHPRDAERLLEVVARAVATGRLAHNEGKAIARLVREWLRARDAGEVEARVEALEQKIAAARRGDLEVME